MKAKMDIHEVEVFIYVYQVYETGCHTKPPFLEKDNTADFKNGKKRRCLQSDKAADFKVRQNRRFC